MAEQKTIYKKLPKEFKEKWIAALKSKKYDQGMFRLHKDNTFCCLGVACIISGINKEKIGTANVIRPSFAKNIIPNILISGSGDENTSVGRLINMNDGGYETQKSFKEIADWIEENL